MKVYIVYDNYYNNVLSCGFLSERRTIEFLVDKMLEDDYYDVNCYFKDKYPEEFGDMGEDKTKELLYKAIEDGEFDDLYTIGNIYVEE